jgi:hypothetical protein
MREIIKLLKKEIKWCEKNKGIKSKEYEKGFIKGLEQAIKLIDSSQ